MFSYLETPRLVIRSLTVSDLENLMSVINEGESFKHLGFNAQLSIKQLKAWIEVSQKNYQEGKPGCVAIISKHELEFVGIVGLHVRLEVPNTTNQAYLMYAIKHTHRRQGLATEAVRAIIDMGFKQYGIKSIVAIIEPHNVASIRLAENIGMSIDKETTGATSSFLYYTVDVLR